MKEEYRREMERLGPRQDELERLYMMIEGGTSMKRKKWIGSRAVAALACAVLLVTAAAAAAVPAVWDALQSHLGAFAPYAQTIEGAVCTAQGIRLQVLSALSDDLEARVYLAARDVEEDRLNEALTLTGRLTAGEAKEPGEVGAPGMTVVGGFSTSVFELISYDPETKTALFSASIHYMDSSRPTGEAQLSVTGMTTRRAMAYQSAPCASVGGDVLESLPAEDGQVIFTPGSLSGGEYDDSVLPGEHVVLAPGQTPMAIEGTEDMYISSMGFASDGCFHVRLGFAEGVSPATFQPVNIDTETGIDLAAGQTRSLLFCDLVDGERTDASRYTIRETLVEGGMDVLFPLIRAEDLDELRGCELRVSGSYFRPGTEVEGDWSVEFELDYHPSAVLDWTGKLAGWQVEQVTVSPLSVTMKSNASKGFRVPLYAVKRDGSTVAAQSGTGSYTNVGALAGEAEDRWEAYTTWQFKEPVEVEDIVALTLGDETIPVELPKNS